MCLNSRDSELTNEEEEEEEKSHLEQSHIRLGEDLGRLKVSPCPALLFINQQGQALSS